MEPPTANTAGPLSSGHTILPNDPRLVRCGFAKLQGDGIEYFVRKYEITIGRTSKNSTLDLNLGDITTISRQHATIRYNFDAKCFELVVLGKNGVQVESSGSGATHLYTPDSPPTPLQSRDLLIMGEKRFYFLLPRAMGGGQSRKRRRLEPSPAPGPVSSGAPTAVMVAPAQAPHAAHPAVAAPESQSAGAQQHEQQQTSMGTTGGLPASTPAQQPHISVVQHPQSVQQQHQEQQQHQQPGVYANPLVQGAAAILMPQEQPYPMHQDEDDALINAGALPYDNGTSYGYDDGNGGFPGGF